MNNFLPTVKDIIAKYKLPLSKDKTKDIHELLFDHNNLLFKSLLAEIEHISTWQFIAGIDCVGNAANNTLRNIIPYK